MVKNILNALVFILIGVILTELTIFYFPDKRKQVALPEVTAPILSPTVALPTPVTDRLAFNSDTLNQIRGYYRSSNLKSELKIEDEGPIQSISGPGKSVIGWEYERVIYVGQEQDRDNQIAVAFNKKQLAEGKFVKLEGGKEVPISIADLKKGDQIKWITTMDLTRPWGEAIKEIKIIKLK
jgi:hypothetical protein